MPFYTLSPGSQCGHNGRDMKPGEVIELDVHVGRELHGKLLPCTAEGVILSDLGPDELVVAQAADHEKGSVLAVEPEIAPVRRVDPSKIPPTVIPPAGKPTDTK